MLVSIKTAPMTMPPCRDFARMSRNPISSWIPTIGRSTVLEAMYKPMSTAEPIAEMMYGAFEFLCLSSQTATGTYAPAIVANSAVSTYEPRSNEDSPADSSLPSCASPICSIVATKYTIPVARTSAPQ